ncbi:cathepsin B [Trichuris trichiura]|uniref:Cathepsin B n=1 Tax=Trichuris trichiura TaxID=36087 RepID=A0A077ZQQ9_TRITR|nr:cathepsin B [Trichuris trichiura]
MGKSLSDIRNLLGYPLEPATESDRTEFPHPDEYGSESSRIELPEQFDSRKNWPVCKDIISHIKDQSNCGSCWAVSAASVMSDRTCIASNGSTAVFLSEEELISCCRICGMGCDGGYPPRAFLYWWLYGVPTGGSYGSNDTCKPYSIAPCKICKGNSDTPKCTKEWVNNYPADLKKDRHFGKLYKLA